MFLGEFTTKGELKTNATIFTQKGKAVKKTWVAGIQAAPIDHLGNCGHIIGLPISFDSAQQTCLQNLDSIEI